MVRGWSRFRWRCRGAYSHSLGLRSQCDCKRSTGLFAEFLAATGVYGSWIDGCPLSYSSGNASQKRDVLGTWFLSIQAGHHRYAHITGLRGDGVSPQILGMSKIVSEDALRRALARMSAMQA